MATELEKLAETQREIARALAVLTEQTRSSGRGIEMRPVTGASEAPGEHVGTAGESRAEASRLEQALEATSRSV